MPLDTTLYPLTHLRTDGRRWNDLRSIHAQITTQPASSSDGSSYVEWGNTKVMCTVYGPREGTGAAAGTTVVVGGGTQTRDAKEAVVETEISVAGFAEQGQGQGQGGGGGGGRRKRGRGDKRILELQHIISSTFSTLLLTHLYSHSLITLTIHVLSTDGSLLAACLNAATLALIDAGVPMKDYLTAVTCGTTATYADDDDNADGDDHSMSGIAGAPGVGDPILDVNASEEQDGVPFLTIGCLGKGAEGYSHNDDDYDDNDNDEKRNRRRRGGMEVAIREEGEEEGTAKVVVLVCETRVPMAALESMVAVGVDGCERVRGLLDGVVKRAGKEVLMGERVR